MLLNEDKNAMLRRELTEGTIETVAALGLEILLKHNYKRYL